MRKFELVNTWPHVQPYNFVGRANDYDCPGVGEILVLAADAEGEIAARDVEIESLKTAIKECISAYDLTSGISNTSRMDKYDAGVNVDNARKLVRE